MNWLERAGYLVVCAVIGAFIFAFNYPVDDLISADKVKIEPYSQSVKAADATLVVRLLAEDFAAVTAGQPIAEVVQGEDAIRRFQQWKSVDDLKAQIGDSPAVQALAAKYSKPPVTVLTAPAAGTVRLDGSKFNGPLAKDAEIARVVDYNDLRMTASLSGQTVPKAQVGQMAKISAITAEPEAGTLFRGYGPGMTAISGRLLGDQVKEVLDRSLAGVKVKVRDDIPLQIKEVSEVQVDAQVTRSPAGDGRAAAQLEPQSGYSVTAQVVEGSPSASVQLADLPEDVERKAIEVVKKAVQNKTVRNVNGSVATLQDVSNVHLVLKLKAEKADALDAGALPATAVSRSFEATLKVQSPPQFLIDAVREADRAGKSVTARVELRTGTRPIAFILLRKS